MKLPNLKYEIAFWKKGYMVMGLDEVGRGAFAGPLFVGGVVFPPTTNDEQRIKLLSHGINDSKKLRARARKTLAEIIRNESLAYHISKVDVAQINRIGIGKATLVAMRDVVKNMRKKLYQHLGTGPILNSLSKGGNHPFENDRLSRSVLLRRQLKVAKGKNTQLIKDVNKRLSFSEGRTGLRDLQTARAGLRETYASDNKIFVLVDGFYIKYLRNVGLANQRGIVHGDEISLSIAAASIIAKVTRDAYMENVSSKYPAYGFGRNKGYGTVEHRIALKTFGPTRLHRKAFVKRFI